MSEVYSSTVISESGVGALAAAAVEAESTPETSGKWDRDDLTPLVSANADVLVNCDWLPGGPVSVMSAMNSYPKWSMITEATQDIAIADVYMLLANRAEEAEDEDEPEVEEEPAEEVKSEAKAEDKKAQQKETQQPKVEQNASSTEKSKTDDNKPEQAVEPAADSKELSLESSTEPVAETPQHANQVEASAQPSSKTATEANVSSVVAEVASSGGGASLEAVAAAPAEAQAPPSEIIATDEVEADDDLDLTVSQQEVEAAAADVELEVSASSAQELEEDYRTDTYELINLAEDQEILISHFEEESEVLAEEVAAIVDLEEAALYTVEAEQDPESVALAEVVEEPVELGVDFQQVEESLTSLAAKIEVSEPVLVEQANEILAKIIEVPAKLEAPAGAEAITETEAQEELEGLFTELFDVLEVEYTPELVESLARLSLNWQIIEEIKKIKDQEEDELQAKDGTHEIIKKILVGLSKLKKALLHAGSIGKSALRLYSLSDLAAGLATPRLAYVTT